MLDITEKTARPIVVAFRTAQAGSGLTGRDRLDLHHWAAQGNRVEIEDGFAMIYRGAEPWAAWGIGREAEQLVVWNCVTYANIGRFGTMREALAVLRHGRAGACPPPPPNVIPFRRVAPAA